MPKKKRVDRAKVYLGGASIRQHQSKSTTILKNLNLLQERVIDYGCGYGFDAILNGYEKYDPFYFDDMPDGLFTTVVNINVLSAVSSKIRSEIIENIQEILEPDGIGYLCVPRNLPKGGKLAGYNRRPQNYIILIGLHTVYLDDEIEIYVLTKTSTYKDKTNNISE
jgi:hypothetical protein